MEQKHVDEYVSASKSHAHLWAPTPVSELG